jgi:hypothetical protein
MLCNPPSKFNKNDSKPVVLTLDSLQSELSFLRQKTELVLTAVKMKPGKPDLLIIFAAIS